jgi:hypothetical protein
MQGYLGRLLLLLAAYHLIGCSGDYAIQLPNGFELVRANEHEISISRPDGLVVVPGKIEKYAVIGKWVTGFAQFADWPNDPARNTEGVQRGYFTVDTETGNVRLGLTKVQWDTWCAQNKAIVVRLESPKPPNWWEK